MASCVKISQSLKQICCDGTTALSGSVSVSLVGPTTSDVCRLYDAADNTSIPTGVVGTFPIVNEAWETCELPCLEDLTYGGNTAIDLGFYYAITVSLTGYSSCTYQVVLDCTTMGLAAGVTVLLEDITLTTPVTPLPGSALATAVQSAETVTTLVDNGNDTITYTNESGAQVTFAVSGGGGGGTSEDGGPYTIVQAANNNITVTDATSNNTFTITAAMIANAVTFNDTNSVSSFSEAGGILTHTDGNGSTTTVNICDVVAANCENNLAFNAGTGALTLTLHDGSTQTVNIGGNETVTTMVIAGNGDRTYTNEAGIQTLIPHETTTNVVEGPAGTFTHTNEDGNTTAWTLPASGAAETVTSLVPNGTTGFTYTNENSVNTAITFPVAPAETTTTVVEGPAGTFTYTNEAGATQAWTLPASGAAETVTSLVDNNNGSFTYTNENAVTTTWNETTSTLVANGTTGFTYTNEDGTDTAITFPAATAGNTSSITTTLATGTWVHNDGTGTTQTIKSTSSDANNDLVIGSDGGTFLNLIGGTNVSLSANVVTGAITIDATGTETTTTLIDNNDGTYTYTNEIGATTVIGSNDGEKIIFQNQALVTSTGISGLDVYDGDIEVYAYQVTVASAPTADETFDLIDTGATGTGTTNIFSGTLANGAVTTGLITLGAAYTVTAGNMIQSNILTATDSEKWALHVFYREVRNELG